MQENIKKDDLKFVTYGSLSRDVYKELVDISMKKNNLMKILAAVYTVLIACAIWSVCHDIMEYVVICVAALLIFGIAVICKRNHSIKISVRRIHELYGTDAIDYMTGFTDDFIYGENKFQVGGYVAISYDNIRCLYNTKQFLFIVTKGSQFLTVFKDCLSDDEQKNFLIF